MCFISGIFFLNTSLNFCCVKTKYILNNSSSSDSGFSARQFEQDQSPCASLKGIFRVTKLSGYKHGSHADTAGFDTSPNKFLIISDLFLLSNCKVTFYLPTSTECFLWYCLISGFILLSPYFLPLIYHSIFDHFLQ